MSTAALSVPSSAQIEGANFLNLLIVDDERAIREVCRDVAQSLGFNTVVADSRGACVSDVRDAEHRCGAARPEIAGSGRAGGPAPNRSAQAGCGHGGSDGIWHGAIRCP